MIVTEIDYLDMFTNAVLDHEGLIFSQATLKTSDLLQSAYLFCLHFGIQAPFMQELEEWFDLEYNAAVQKCFCLAIDYGHLADDASWIWNEEVFNYFNDIAPDGYYFGNTEGDGALFGFFKLEDAEVM